MRIFKNKQGAIELLDFCFIFTIFVLALLAMGPRIKGSLQGRWEEALSGFGDQYDPRYTSSDIRMVYDASMVEQVSSVKNASGVYETVKKDSGTVTETKTGYMDTGPYSP